MRKQLSDVPRSRLNSISSCSLHRRVRFSPVPSVHAEARRIEVDTCLSFTTQRSCCMCGARAERRMSVRWTVGAFGGAPRGGSLTAARTTTPEKPTLALLTAREEDAGRDLCSCTGSGQDEPSAFAAVARERARLVCTGRPAGRPGSTVGAAACIVCGPDTTALRESRISTNFLGCQGANWAGTVVS